MANVANAANWTADGMLYATMEGKVIKWFTHTLTHPHTHTLVNSHTHIKYMHSYTQTLT